MKNAFPLSSNHSIDPPRRSTRLRDAPQTRKLKLKQEDPSLILPWSNSDSPSSTLSLLSSSTPDSPDSEWRLSMSGTKPEVQVAEDDGPKDSLRPGQYVRVHGKQPGLLTLKHDNHQPFYVIFNKQTGVARKRSNTSSPSLPLSSPDLVFAYFDNSWPSAWVVYSASSDDDIAGNNNTTSQSPVLPPGDGQLSVSQFDTFVKAMAAFHGNCRSTDHNYQIVKMETIFDGLPESKHFGGPAKRDPWRRPVDERSHIADCVNFEGTPIQILCRARQQSDDMKRQRKQRRVRGALSSPSSKPKKLRKRSGSTLSFTNPEDGGEDSSNLYFSDIPSASGPLPSSSSSSSSSLALSNPEFPGMPFDGRVPFSSPEFNGAMTLPAHQPGTICPLDLHPSTASLENPPSFPFDENWLWEEFRKDCPMAALQWLDNKLKDIPVRREVGGQ